MKGVLLFICLFLGASARSTFFFSSGLNSVNISSGWMRTPPIPSMGSTLGCLDAQGRGRHRLGMEFAFQKAKKMIYYEPYSVNPLKPNVSHRFLIDFD